MRSAIYYPHTKIRNKAFLKTALLLWDEVHVIVPWLGYELEPSPPIEAAAFELLGRKLHPSEREKKQAHQMIEDFVTRPLPRSFFLEPEGGSHEYEMFAHKLLPETWDLLRHARMARPALRRGSHYSATVPMGLALMNLLADCCAGDVFARVTDRGDAYASLAGLFIEESDMSEEIDSGRSGANQLLLEMEHSDDSVALVPIAIEVVNANSLTLEQVVGFRREECKSSGHSLRDLRHRFADSIAEQARRLSGVRSAREKVEIRRQFREDVRDDYLALRDALKLEAKQVLGSKEIVTAALVSLAQIGAGLFTIPDEFSKLSFAASTVVIGGLYSSKSKFAQTRRKILEEHPTAYLYEAQGRLRL